MSIYAEYSPFQRSLNPLLVLLPSEMNDTRNRSPSAAILYVRLRHTSVKLAQHGSILSIYVKMHVSLITIPGPTKLNRENYWAKFLGLFGGVRPAREFVPNLEMLQLPVNGCNFFTYPRRWPLWLLGPCQRSFGTLKINDHKCGA